MVPVANTTVHVENFMVPAVPVMNFMVPGASLTVPSADTNVEKSKNR